MTRCSVPSWCTRHGWQGLGVAVGSLAFGPIVENLHACRHVQDIIGTKMAMDGCSITHQRDANATINFALRGTLSVVGPVGAAVSVEPISTAWPGGWAVKAEGTGHPI